RLPHVARDNRAAESKRRLVANERRSPAFAEATAGKLVGRPKKSGLETAPLGQLIPTNFKLGARSLKTASARTLWPSGDACQPSIGWSNSTRPRSAVASAWEYRN